MNPSDGSGLKGALWGSLPQFLQNKAAYRKRSTVGVSSADIQNPVTHPYEVALYKSPGTAGYRGLGLAPICLPRRTHSQA